MNKACLHSSCSTVATKKFKRIQGRSSFLVELQSYIVQQWTPSQTFSNVFSRNCRMIYYNGIVGHYTIVLRFHRSLWKNGKNILKGEYQKEGEKYGGGGGWYLSDTYCNLHMLVTFFMRTSPLVHISKWWLSLRDKPWDLCKARSTLWSFCNPSWLDIWTFWSLVTLCSMTTGLQHNCKVKGGL